MRDLKLPKKWTPARHFYSDWLWPYFAITDVMLIKEMVAEQLEKLKTEKEERARAGAATPPSPAPSNDSADNRHILQPVDNPESPDSGSQVEFVQ